MVDRILAQQAKYKGKETENTIPELLQKPRKRDKETVKKNLIDTLDKVNIVKKIKELRKENKKLTDENTKLTQELQLIIQQIDPQRKIFGIEK